MVAKTLKVENKVGLHARPASLLIMAAQKYQCRKNLSKEDMSSDLTGIFTLLKLQCQMGDEITISCDGSDEEACLMELTKLIESKFGED